MQQTSQLYNTLLAAGAPKEARALIYWATNSYDIYYGYDDPNNPNGAQIVSATTRASMLDSSLSIGNCIAKELNLVVRNFAGYHTIPRMAKIVMQFRLNDGTQQSEWIPKGTFYIDTRDESYEGVLTINAYDSMLKSEQSFTKSGEQGQWPRPDIRAVSDTRKPDGVVNTIAAAMGVEIDQRTFAVMKEGYLINYPGIVLDNGIPQYSQDGAMSMRQILGYIGAMYGGNWVITDENKLRLIVLGDIPKFQALLIDENGNYITMGGYQIYVG